MSVLALLQDFERAGGKLAIKRGEVEVQFPEGQRKAVASALAALREHREEVIRLLQERSARSIQRKPVRARIIGQNRIAVSGNIEECWHCGASGRCGCAACGAIDGHGRDVAGECRACHGTGHILFAVAQ